MSWSRSTRDGQVRLYATSKKTVKVPARNPTTYSCQIVRTSRANATGMEASRSGSTDIAGDQDRPAAEPVHPGAGREAEQDERQEFDRAEHRDLERRRLEDRDRDERDGEQADLRPELADGLGGPQLEEIGVAKQAPAGLGHRGSLPSSFRAGRPWRAAEPGHGAVAGRLASWRADRVRSQRLRGPPPRRHRPPGGRHLERPGVFLLDRTSDGSHNRSVFTLAGEHEPVTEALERLVAGGDPRASTWTATPANTPASGPWMSSRSCRWPTRRWTIASPSPGRSGSGSPTASTCRSTSMRRPPRAPSGSSWPMSGAASTRASRPRSSSTAASPTSARRGCIRRPGPSRSARGRSSSPTTSTWRPRTWSWPSASPRRVRESGGGLPRVQGNGFWIEELRRAQVSMNLLDFTVTPLWLVWETVRDIAAEDGVELAESELIGLAPLAALLAVADRAGAPDDDPDRRPTRRRGRVPPAARLLAAAGPGTAPGGGPIGSARVSAGFRVIEGGRSEEPSPGLLIVGAAEVATMAGGVRAGFAAGRDRPTDRGSDAGPGPWLRARSSPAGRAGSPRSGRARRSRQPSRRKAIRSGDSPASTLTAASSRRASSTHTPTCCSVGHARASWSSASSGASYMDILAAGGGILSTVAATRATDDETLTAHGRRWLDEMLGHGVTTVEAKSGLRPGSRDRDPAAPGRLGPRARGTDRHRPDLPRRACRPTGVPGSTRWRGGVRSVGHRRPAARRGRPRPGALLRRVLRGRASSAPISPGASCRPRRRTD